MASDTKVGVELFCILAELSDIFLVGVFLRFLSFCRLDYTGLIDSVLGLEIDGKLMSSCMINLWDDCCGSKSSEKQFLSFLLMFDGVWENANRLASAFYSNSSKLFLLVALAFYVIFLPNLKFDYCFF